MQSYFLHNFTRNLKFLATIMSCSETGTDYLPCAPTCAQPIQSRYKDRGAWAIFSNIEIHLCGCSLAKAFLFFWSYHDTKLATYWLKFTIFVSSSIQQIFSYISHNDNKCHDPAIIRNISQANIADMIMMILMMSTSWPSTDHHPVITSFYYYSTDYQSVISQFCFVHSSIHLFHDL